jgi:ribonuclease BN (tRNA processing enzyme)
VGLDLREVGTCLYTHLHPDHTADLIPFLFGRKYYPGGGGGDVALWGPPGFSEFFRRLQSAWENWADPEGAFGLTVQEVPAGGEPFEVAGVQVRAYAVEHMHPSVAYRFEDPDTGRSLCYSGDTDFCEGILEAARGVDVLVIECSLPDEQAVDGHLSPSKVAKVARETGAGRVLITHLYPVIPPGQMRAACEIALGSPVELGEDGMSVLV